MLAAIEIVFSCNGVYLNGLSVFLLKKQSVTHAVGRDNKMQYRKVTTQDSCLFYDVFLFRLIIIVLIFLLLTACGGGGSNGNGDNVREDIPAKTYTLSKGGSISIPKDALPDGVTVEITETELPPLIDEIEAVGTAYLIDIDSELSLPATIKLPIPDGENTQGLVVIRIENNGAITILQTSVQNNMLVALTDGFSTVSTARLKALLSTIDPQINGPGILPGDVTDTEFAAQYHEAEYFEVPGLKREWQINTYGDASGKVKLSVEQYYKANNLAKISFKEAVTDGQIILRVKLIEPNTGVNVIAFKTIYVSSAVEYGALPLELHVISPLVVEKEEVFRIKVNVLNPGQDSITEWDWQLTDIGGDTCSFACADTLTINDLEFDIAGQYEFKVSATTSTGREAQATFIIYVRRDLEIIKIEPDPLEFTWKPEFILPSIKATIIDTKPAQPPFTYSWNLDPGLLLPREFESNELSSTFQPEIYEPGNYKISLEVEDHRFTKAKREFFIDVGGEQDLDIILPNPISYTPEEVNKNIEIEVKFSGGVLIKNGRRSRYKLLVDWGDKSPSQIYFPAEELYISVSGATKTLSHTYEEAGDYTLNIVVCPTWYTQCFTAIRSFKFPELTLKLSELESTNVGVESVDIQIVEDCDEVTKNKIQGRGCIVNIDFDGDGYFSIDSGGDDCDDSDTLINPGKWETADDGIDQDCSGSDFVTPTEAICPETVLGYGLNDNFEITEKTFQPSVFIADSPSGWGYIKIAICKFEMLNPGPSTNKWRDLSLDYSFKKTDEAGFFVHANAEGCGKEGKYVFGEDPWIIYSTERRLQASIRSIDYTNNNFVNYEETLAEFLRKAVDNGVGEVCPF